MLFSPHLVETANWVQGLSEIDKNETKKAINESVVMGQAKKEVLELLLDSAIRDRVLNGS